MTSSARFVSVRFVIGSKVFVGGIREVCNSISAGAHFMWHKGILMEALESAWNFLCNGCVAFRGEAQHPIRFLKDQWRLTKE